MLLTRDHKCVDLAIGSPVVVNEQAYTVTHMDGERLVLSKQVLVDEPPDKCRHRFALLSEAHKRRADIDDLQREGKRTRRDGDEKETAPDEVEALQSASDNHMQRLETLSGELESLARQVVFVEATLSAHQGSDWGTYVPEQAPVAVHIAETYSNLPVSWKVGPAPPLANQVLLLPGSLVFSTATHTFQQDMAGKQLMCLPERTLAALDVRSVLKVS